MLAQDSERENCTPGKGSAAGQNFLAPRYYGQRTAQCLRLSKMCLSHVCYHSDAWQWYVGLQVGTESKRLHISLPDLQSEGCRFEFRPGLLRTKVYSAFHPSGVGKWVPTAAGKAKAGMAHSNCGWACGCAGKTEIPWEHVPYLSASAVVFHCEEVLYQVYVPLPLPFTFTELFHRLDRDIILGFQTIWRYEISAVTSSAGY